MSEAGSAGVPIDVRQHLLASAQDSPSEGVPIGVPPNWGWVSAATSTSTTAPDAAHTHANYWGALFRGQSDTTPANTLIEIRDCSMWFLREGESEWSQSDASAELGGETFSPSYAKGGPAPLVLMQEPAGVDVVPAPGNIFHFWQGNGYQPLGGPVREIVTNCRARLQLRDFGSADDRAGADYLIHMGADFRDPSDPSCAKDNYICPSWGVSRLERVTSAWRNHTFHSITATDLDGGVPLPPSRLFDLPAN